MKLVFAAFAFSMSLASVASADSTGAPNSTPPPVVIIPEPPPDYAFQIYRYRNGDSVLLTIWEQEQRNLNRDADWKREFTAIGWAYDRQVAGSIPLYRLRHQQTGDRLFTTSVEEVNVAKFKYNYVLESICCYIAPGPEASGISTILIYRLRRGAFHLYGTLQEMVAEEKAHGGEMENPLGYVWHSKPPTPH